MLPCIIYTIYILYTYIYVPTQGLHASASEFSTIYTPADTLPLSLWPPRSSPLLLPMMVCLIPLRVPLTLLRYPLSRWRWTTFPRTPTLCHEPLFLHSLRVKYNTWGRGQCRFFVCTTCLSDPILLPIFFLPVMVSALIMFLLLLTATGVAGLTVYGCDTEGAAF